MPARKPAEPELAAEPRVGIAICHLSLRRFQPQPARFVIGAASDAEEARGGPSNLIVLAVDPDDDLDAVLDAVRGAVASARDVV